MKRNFTKTSFLMVCLLSMGSITFAQTPDPYLFDDFEPGSVNSAGICTDDVNTNPPPVGWNWNGTSAPTIAANPDPSGINTSSTVLFCARAPEMVAWTGPKINDAEWGTAFADTWGGPISGYNYMHIMMYSNQVIQPGVNTGGPDAEAMNVADIVPYTWVDVVFDLTAYPVVTMIAILIDQTDPLGQESDVYMDNIILTNDPTPRTVSSGINIITENNVTVFAANGTLYISGSDDPVQIYNAAGQMVYENSLAKNLSIELAKGIYIVKAGATTKKVLVQ